MTQTRTQVKIYTQNVQKKYVWHALLSHNKPNQTVLHCFSFFGTQPCVSPNNCTVMMTCYWMFTLSFLYLFFFSEGQSVTLQALLPDVGGTLLLEGPSGSGKTILAHMLVSSWTEGPTDALADLLDLSALRLLLHVDCSTEKRDLFQEMTSPLPPRGKVLTEDQLRTVLTRSNSSLLLLDGYREGNFYFDESLRRFLGERKGCRVLVMSRPEHCPTFKKTVGTEGLLKLQTQTAKYWGHTVSSNRRSACYTLTKNYCFYDEDLFVCFRFCVSPNMLQNEWRSSKYLCKKWNTLWFCILYKTLLIFNVLFWASFIF